MHVGVALWCLAVAAVAVAFTCAVLDRKPVVGDEITVLTRVCAAASAVGAAALVALTVWWFAT